MAFSDAIVRANVSSLIPEDMGAEIMGKVAYESAALSLFTNRTMAANQQREPVLDALPYAYFVNGEGGMKQTTTVAWKNKYLNVEEIACIVVLPKNTVNDLGGTSVWNRLKPLVISGVARALDGAVFFGAGKPASWDAAIADGAAAAGNVYNRGTNAASLGGLSEDVNALMALTEAEGYDVSGFVTGKQFKHRLRGARDTTGQKILDVKENTLYETPIKYALDGLWSSGSGSEELFAGDFSQGIIGIRQDITIEFFNSGVIQDPVTGEIKYNLIQQNLYAWRVDSRFAFAVANPINWMQQTEASRYPFGVLLAP